MKSKITSKIILSTLFVLSFSHLATAAENPCLILSKNLKYGQGVKGVDLRVIRLSQDSPVSQVVSLQNFLIESGHMKGVATGYFGGQTLAAVKKYQKANNISATGFVGEKTRKIINASCNTRVAMCSYANPPVGCSYVPGPDYNSVSSCGMVLKCDSTSTTTDLLKACPQEKVTNKMPVMCIKAPCPPVDNSYYIYNRVRKEVSDFDIEYVKNNCSVKESVVY